MATERKHRRFKRQAVRRMTESNKHCTQHAREKNELDAKSEDASPGSGQPASPEGEMARLKRENDLLKQENEILKMAAAYLAKTLV